MRPLLWKEMRELRPYLLAGAVFTAALALLLVSHVFGEGIVSAWMFVLMPFIMISIAITLGARQIAGERHARTLDFLLVRPVAAGTVVWSKFLAGCVVLALFVAAGVALGYAHKDIIIESGLQPLRDVSVLRLVFTLIPRFWCLYALTFLFSVLLDRVSRVWALAGVLVIALFVLATVFDVLAPFSGFVYWLPYFESAGGLTEAAKSWNLSGITGLVYTSAAVLITAISARMLKRSPERYLGNIGLATAVVTIVVAAIASANVASNRLPELSPVGTLAIDQNTDGSIPELVASGSDVAIGVNDVVRFFDFSDPTRPKGVAEVSTPLWQSLRDQTSSPPAMTAGIVFRVGQKKQLPVDDFVISMVRPAGPVETISLGPVRAEDSVSSPIPVPPYVYVVHAQSGVYSLRVFHIASRIEVAALVIDHWKSPFRPEWSPSAYLVKSGTYLYVNSPHQLTTLDISNPAKPTITTQLPAARQPDSSFDYTRRLTWQGHWLVEVPSFPQKLVAYDLTSPSNPVQSGRFLYHPPMPVYTSERALYRQWQGGALEFTIKSDGPHARRYLNGGGQLWSLAASGDSVYALIYNHDSQQHRKVQAFHVGR